MGDFYLVERAAAFDGKSQHYSARAVHDPSVRLMDNVSDLWDKTHDSTLHPVKAATGDAIYREDDYMLDGFRAADCDIVNLDSSHLYAASRNNSADRVLKTIQCGVISDVISTEGSEGAESTLSVMLSDEPTGDLIPLERTGEIVSFYIEELAPTLVSG